MTQQASKSIGIALCFKIFRQERKKSELFMIQKYLKKIFTQNKALRRILTYWQIVTVLRIDIRCTVESVIANVMI